MSSLPKYSYNVNCFKSVNSEESAYWLGFLYADGSVSKTGKRFALGLCVKDRSHVEKFRDFVCPDRPVDECPKQNACKITVCSMAITSDLINLGCIPQKSLTLRPPTPNQVPPHLVHHFIRGYFDGDGCISHSKEFTRLTVSLVGTMKFLEFCRQHFIKCGADCRVQVYSDGKMKAFRWRDESMKDVKYIYNYMYKDATIFLKRKRDVFTLYHIKDVRRKAICLK